MGGFGLLPVAFTKGAKMCPMSTSSVTHPACLEIHSRQGPAIRSGRSDASRHPGLEQASGLRNLGAVEGAMADVETIALCHRRDISIGLQGEGRRRSRDGGGFDPDTPRG